MAFGVAFEMVIFGPELCCSQILALGMSVTIQMVSSVRFLFSTRFEIMSICTNGQDPGDSSSLAGQGLRLFSSWQKHESASSQIKSALRLVTLRFGNNLQTHRFAGAICEIPSENRNNGIKTNFIC